MLLNDPVEEVLANEARVAVNSDKGTLGKGPSLLSVVRNLRVVVVQAGDGHLTRFVYA